MSDDHFPKAKDIAPKDGPETATSLDGDDTDIDASLRECSPFCHLSMAPIGW